MGVSPFLPPPWPLQILTNSVSTGGSETVRPDTPAGNPPSGSHHGGRDSQSLPMKRYLASKEHSKSWFSGVHGDGNGNCNGSDSVDSDIDFGPTAWPYCSGGSGSSGLGKK